MIRTGIDSLLAIVMVLSFTSTRARAEASTNAMAAPDFNEVYAAVRSHLPEMSEPELNRAAVQGLLSALGPRVLLVTNGTVAKSAAETNLITKSILMDDRIAYLRVEAVADGLANATRTAYDKLAGTNKLKGVVLDLRFTHGDDYAAAAHTADLFLKKELPLLNWGTGVVRSREKSDAIALPVAVLVNRQTSGAAEALAAALRQSGAGLLLGRRTAGQAMIAKDFPLKNGDLLRIAAAPVRLGDDSPLSWQGLKPDIAVQVAPEDEQGFYADAFKTTGRTGLTAASGSSATNQTAVANRTPRRARLNEAELVRERREGISEADIQAFRNREPDQPQIQDPTLARALDLLKGLAVVRQGRP